MSLADIALDVAAQEYNITKDHKYQDEKWKRLAIECLYNQIIRLHCYAKGLEYALDEKNAQESIPVKGGEDQNEIRIEDVTCIKLGDIFTHDRNKTQWNCSGIIKRDNGESVIELTVLQVRI